MTEKQETWQSRVTDWRASGKTAAEFSRRQGFAASTLRWWSSRLGREAAAAVAAPVVAAPAIAAPTIPTSAIAAPVVRLARVVRSNEPATTATTGNAVIIEMLAGRVRIVVEPGVDLGTLATVLDLLSKEGAR